MTSFVSRRAKSFRTPPRLSALLQCPRSGAEGMACDARCAMHAAGRCLKRHRPSRAAACAQLKAERAKHTKSRVEWEAADELRDLKLDDATQRKAIDAALAFCKGQGAVTFKEVVQYGLLEDLLKAMNLPRVKSQMLKEKLLKEYGKVSMRCTSVLGEWLPCLRSLKEVKDIGRF